MLPKKIKVAGIDYEVQEVSQIAGDDDLLGQTHYETAKILLKKGMSEDREEQTLIHELVHAVFYETGIYEHDENLIDRVAIVMYQVLKDNPKLLTQNDVLNVPVPFELKVNPEEASKLVQRMLACGDL